MTKILFVFSETFKCFAFTKLPLLVWPSIEVTVYLLKLFFDQGVKLIYCCGLHVHKAYLGTVKIG